MLKKIKRRKIRKGTPFERTDLIYKGLMIDKIKDKYKYHINKALITSNYFDDDLYIHQLEQKRAYLSNKLFNLKFPNQSLYICYPSYIPVGDKGIMIERHEFYWNNVTFETNCVKCGNKHRVFYGNFKLTNLLCGNCINAIVEPNKNKFSKKTSQYKTPIVQILTDFSTQDENHIYLVKNTLQVFKKNKELYKKFFNKIIKRLKQEHTEYPVNKDFILNINRIARSVNI